METYIDETCVNIVRPRHTINRVQEHSSVIVCIEKTQIVTFSLFCKQEQYIMTKEERNNRKGINIFKKKPTCHNVSVSVFELVCRIQKVLKGELLFRLNEL